MAVEVFEVSEVECERESLRVLAKLLQCTERKVWQECSMLRMGEPVELPEVD